MKGSKMNTKFSKESVLLKGISAFTAFVFVFTQILIPTRAYAQVLKPAGMAAAQIEIPEEAGKIEQVIPSPDTGRVIVHIQTAHGNEDAQKNIQRMLTDLSEHQGFDVLFLEGGSGKLHPELLRFFPK